MAKRQESFDPTDPQDIDGPFEDETVTLRKTEYETLMAAAQDGLILKQIEDCNLDLMRLREPSEPRFKFFVGRYTCGEDLQTAWAKFKEADS